MIQTVPMRDIPEEFLRAMAQEGIISNADYSNEIRERNKATTVCLDDGAKGMSSQTLAGMIINALPARHGFGLSLRHNPHFGYHESVGEYLNSHDGYEQSEWISEQDYQKSLATGELWELIWYPDSPVGSYTIRGATLEAILIGVIGDGYD